jgi:hypothetical protein
MVILTEDVRGVELKRRMYVLMSDVDSGFSSSVRSGNDDICLTFGGWYGCGESGDGERLCHGLG